MEPDQQSRTATDGTAADHERSGATIAEAVARAEEGRPPEDVHQPPEDSAAGSAPVEQRADDPAMTKGQVVAPTDRAGENAAEPKGGRSPSPPQSDEQSGGAQSQPGPRISDLVAAGEPEPNAPPVGEHAPGG